ncbi:hypothetical protein Poli38472_011962 [Pythium oligandrum]|uniref:Choline transporter-like protein n=1 Tax=Pythium oligandrum TaxID=41045 RepID=A0A8K1CNE6_PYTOL|nr:hypothetical protein Poli38472_011962 [Pythium oligandrum]|eukprot:TMW66846.1 hypothetical protein Poli38472_011962 [Pythium oligandrum]
MGNRCCKRAETPPADDGEGSNPFKPSNRKCTDLLFVLLFFVFWIGMIIIAGVAYKHGEPKRLVYGTDWKGRTCGVKADAKDGVPAYDFTKYPYLMYPRLSEDIVALYGENPDASDLMSPSALSKFYGVCVTECPMLDKTSPTYVHAYIDYVLNVDPVNKIYTKAGKSVEDEDAGSPWRLMVDTTNVLNRCLELSKVEVQQSARCIDDCSADEIADYQTSGATQTTCGQDPTLNPLRDCGNKECTAFVLSYRASCTSIETSRQEKQVTSARSDPIIDMLSRRYYMVARWIGDVQKAAFPILICGGGFALILGFLWLLMLRFCAGLFVWIVIILVIIMQLVITLFCAYEGNLLNSTKIDAAMTKMGVQSGTFSTYMSDSANYINGSGFKVTEDQVHYWAIACYVLIAADVVLLLVLVFMCSRIRIAIGIIREASKALQTMPSLVFYPVLPTIFAMGLVAYWVVAAAYIMTSASITLKDVQNAAGDVVGKAPPISAEIENNNVVNYLLIYHLFGLLWTNQFIQAIAYTTIAGCFCEYYWTLDKRQVPGFAVMRSMWRTTRYHLGSMAFGSLIIAVVQMLRLGLEYIDQKMRSAKQGNSVIKVIMCCLKCCMWCFEKCVKFLNNNAFILVAMKGASFCPAMKDSFLLLFNNAARVATVSIITRFLMILGKLFIAAFSMFFMFLFIRYPPVSVPTFFLGDLKDIDSPIFPMLVTGLLGYATASFFLDVYGTGIDTILLCFCEDCNVNKASNKYYMSDELFAYIDGPAKKNAFKAYQPTRDVSSRDRPAGAVASPVTAPPIYSASPPKTKK